MKLKDLENSGLTEYSGIGKIKDKIQKNVGKIIGSKELSAGPEQREEIRKKAEKLYIAWTKRNQGSKQNHFNDFLSFISAIEKKNPSIKPEDINQAFKQAGINYSYNSQQ